MKRKWTWMRRAMLAGVLLCAWLCLDMGAAGAPDGGLPPSLLRGLPPGTRRMFEARSDEERKIVTHHLSISPHMVDASLEIREQIDFRLTPALLVQEAISDGIILTYPEE